MQVHSSIARGDWQLVQQSVQAGNHNLDITAGQIRFIEILADVCTAGTAHDSTADANHTVIAAAGCQGKNFAKT